MRKIVGFLLAFSTPIAAHAGVNTQTGAFKGLTYTATSTIIGQTSTAALAGGGNPIYLAQASQYRGVVGLLIDEGAAGRFVCSGSLSADRSSIITAGHCVSDGSAARPVSVTAYFYNGDPSDQRIYTPGSTGVTTVGISQIAVNPLYTGEVIDDHDIAVLRLADLAPAFAVGYQLYAGADLTGVNYNVAGYGLRSDVGGSLGVTPPHNLQTGFLRQGDNRYDFRLGDPDFAGFFAGGPNGFFGAAETDYSYLADFDDGLAANDASCGLATGPDGFGLPVSGKYCDFGRGLTEVGTAGGDSGGPQFVDGKLASITSYGLTFGNSVEPGDVDNSLNDSFGEFNGFVPIFHNLDFINSALAGAVPEPGAWTLMIAGFGLVGATSRRTRRARLAAA